MDKQVLVSREESQHLTLEKYLVKPNEKISLETTGNCFYYVISGYAVMMIEKYGYSLEPETGLFVPQGSVHEILNTGDVDFSLAIYTSFTN